MYQMPDLDNIAQAALARPSLPGNHSCSMFLDGQFGKASGFWCSEVRRSLTDLCPRGTYQPSSGYTTCLLCPAGTYQPKEGSIDCLPCKDKEYCPVGTFNPMMVSKSNASHVTWDFPITEAAAPTFEEILLLLLFAPSITNNTSVSIVLLGCIVITSGTFFISFFGIQMSLWF